MNLHTYQKDAVYLREWTWVHLKQTKQFSCEGAVKCWVSNVRQIQSQLIDAASFGP